MTRKLLFLLAIITFYASGALAQTPACPTPAPPGAESCNSTCVYCDFNGYMGTNNGTPSGGNSGCPSISLHNDQWFGFVAGTDFISIDVLTTVAGCTTPDGLQAAFYDACGENAIECNGGSDGGAGSPLNLSYGGFVPGQTYYLMIDGYSGCVCDYEISVSAGSITPPPPGVATQPQGPLKVCPGAEVVYTIPAVDAAGFYQWTAPAGASINGGPSSASFEAPEGTEVTITFGSAGGSVCVRVGNACFPSTQACINVVNQPIPPTQLPIKRICYNELPFEWEEEPHTIINNPGTFNLTSTPYDSYLGCDSTVKQTIIARQIVTNNLGVQYICEGQCYTINGNSYCNNTGQTTENFETYDGCDSLVTFSVQKVNANAVILPPVSINCTNPSIDLNSTGSTALNGGVTYAWKNSTWGMLGMNNVTQTISTGGIYHLIVTNQSGTAFCRDTATITVTDNTVPPGVMVISDSMNCISTSAFLQGSSGTAGVNYLWSGPGITPANQFLQNPTVNVPGTYTLVVTNPVNSCTSAGTAIVAADNQPPGAALSNATLNCNVASTVLTPVTNGVSGVTYLWTGPGITAANQSLQNQTVSTGGTFTVTVTNPVNGCTSTASATVAKDVEIPTANAGVDQQITCLAPNITLNGAGSATTGPVSYSWTGPGITPANQNVANPTVNTAGTYILTIQNGTNFCSKTDTVTVVSNAVLPDAVAGTDQLLTCADTVVTLNSNGSSQGANYTATWTGPGITPANQNQYNPQVEVNGVYTIQILNTDNGCTQTDQVTVNINTTAPTANAGNNQLLTCTTTNGVTLSGNGIPANVTYLWTGPGVGANNETQQNPQVTVAGLYTVQITNPANGCTDTATVQVTQDANVPVANAGPDPVINCTVSVVDINASASTMGGNITYEWSGPGINATNINVQSPTGLTLPGIYNLTVTNTTNDCKQTDVVVVVLDNMPPVADAGADIVLNCKNGVTDTLIGAASTTGANITYTWSGAGINASNQHDINPIITALDGLYTLLVTNTDNTCTSTATVMANLDITEPAADAGLDQI
ncbi:MAG: hypothetical protein IT269_10035, partial [Saprospiraceae bacterium]|nr:hypothetical protein [Saprospiraceae bacterium]